ncbi:MAG: hypothetical protein N3G80_02750 [Candidatus Micrarchaeota archaeon]|nr:hypothetical protein [Candidatus Micrarchaeota archaeon]
MRVIVLQQAKTAEVMESADSTRSQQFRVGIKMTIQFLLFLAEK